jgi:hypothetical protein
MNDSLRVRSSENENVAGLKIVSARWAAQRRYTNIPMAFSQLQV